MADSRQRYTHDIGVPQYEWYYIEGVGVYDGQYPEYTYATSIFEELQGASVHYCHKVQERREVLHLRKRRQHRRAAHTPCKCRLLRRYERDERPYGNGRKRADDSGNATTEVFDEGVTVQIGDENYTLGVYFTVHEVYDFFTGDLTGLRGVFVRGVKAIISGGVFRKATTVKSMFDNIFFGTENASSVRSTSICGTSQGEIPRQYYTFDERTIYSGCATKMDCCDIPHLTKSTIKKSTVIKTKSLSSSAAKIKVRTNRKAYEQIARINSSLFSFDDMDFTDFTFNTTEQSLFAIKEKEKKWVEKQYYIYSDEYMKPFSLYYVSFRYRVVGRLKN